MEGDSDFEIQKSELVLISQIKKLKKRKKNVFFESDFTFAPPGIGLDLFKGAPSSRQSFLKRFSLSSSMILSWNFLSLSFSG